MTGQAVLENLHYGVYALGAGLDASRFTAIKDGIPHLITTKMVAKNVEVAYPQEPLTRSLVALCNQENDPKTTWGQWRRVRNTPAHRMAPGLHVHIQFGGVGPWRTVRSWAENLELDASTTATRRKWLATTLLELLGAAYAFVRAHL